MTWKTLLPAAALIAAPILTATPAAAAADPGVKCAQGYAKAVGKCIKKAATTHAKCFKKTGAECAADDADLAKNFEKTADGIRKKCENDSAVAGAGYGPYKRPALGYFGADQCKWNALLISERAFDSDGSNWPPADKDAQKCLQTAVKEAGKFVSKQVGAFAKCLEGGCSFDFSAAAAEVVTTLGDKCGDFAGTVGTDATTFVAAASEQISRAVTSPCDPMDTTRCAFPWPNDLYTIEGADTDSGRRLAIGRNTLPATGGGAAVNPARWNEADGFSIGPMLLFNDVEIDLAMTGAAPITDVAESLDPATPAMLLDAETGAQQLFWLERDLRGATIADQPIIGRIAKNLKESHRYIVVLRNMKDSSGATLDAPEGFAVYRDGIPTTLLPVEARRAHMNDLLDTISGFGIDTTELYMAWDFTTQSTQSTAGRLLAMRDETTTILGGSAPSFTVGTVTQPLDGNIFRQVDGTFQVPLYLNGGGIPGSTLRTDGEGVPQNEGDFFTANFRCLIPYAATTGGSAPAVPARISLYGHGLLGSHTEVAAGNVRDMASEHNMVFCATDWTGFASDDSLYVLQVVQNFSNFPPFIDRQHQGILNMLTLGKLMQHPNGLASDPAFQVGGQSVLDTSNLFYDGNSQGGILGGVVAAFSQDVTRLSLGVPGINYSLLLNRSIDFDEFDALLIASYPSSTDRNLLLSAAQVLWDRTDPSGHVNHVTSDPYPGTPAKTLLYQVAFGDHQVAPVSAEIAARSVGAHIHTPTLQMSKVVPELTPYYGIPAIPSYPFGGSALVIWDSGNPAPPIGNIPPPEITPIDPEWSDLGPCPQGSNSDPHSCPRKNANARQQKSDFLQAAGVVTDVCGGAACLAP